MSLTGEAARDEFVTNLLTEGGVLTELTIPPRKGRLLTSAELRTRLAVITSGQPGSTFSPLQVDAVEPETPDRGFCVALRGTDLHTSSKAQFGDIRHFDDDEQEAAKQTKSDFQKWRRDMQPLLETGRAWVGTWNNPKTDDFEVSVSLVFDPDQSGALGYAMNFAGPDGQDQISLYDLERGETIGTGGSGESPWSSTQRLANMRASLPKR